MNCPDMASGLNFNFILKIAGQLPPLPGQGPSKPLPGSLVPDIFPGTNPMASPKLAPLQLQMT